MEIDSREGALRATAVVVALIWMCLGAGGSFYLLSAPGVAWLSSIEEGGSESLYWVISYYYLPCISPPSLRPPASPGKQAPEQSMDGWTDFNYLAKPSEKEKLCLAKPERKPQQEVCMHAKEKVGICPRRWISQPIIYNRPSARYPAFCNS